MMIFGKNEQWVTYDFMCTEQKSKRCQKTNLDCQFRLSAAFGEKWSTNVSAETLFIVRKLYDAMFIFRY